MKQILNIIDESGTENWRERNEKAFDEPISKIFVLFEKGMIKPISFHWPNRDYTITRNNMHWVDRRPDQYDTAFP